MFEKYFELRENGTNLKTEILAGITVFLAMGYIVIVNPIILGQAGLPQSGVATATILITVFSSILMGVYAKNPIAVAPGMGLNAYFTFSVVKGMNVTPEVALGTVFWSGVFFVILSASNIRSKIVEAIPKQLRYAVSCGIGLFIAVIGFVNAGFVVASPATLITQGALNAKTITFMLGLFLTSFFLVKKIPGGTLLGIITTTVLAIPIGRFWGSEVIVSSFSKIISMPDFSLFLKLELLESLKLVYVPVIFSFLFTDMFDSLSTFMGVAEAGNLLDKEGNPRNLKKSLLADAISTLISGILGSSSGTSYIESAAGVNAGGRTGLVAVVAGLCFVPLLFFSPLLSLVPSLATAPVLVLVGVFMMVPITKINWYSLDDAVPAFLAAILIPMTYSITNGIVWGMLSFLVLKVLSKKYHEVNLGLVGVCILSVIALYLGHFH
ncbi:MAG: permease [Bdellovibrionales bacterium RIFOXYB1_FULL_37_110]|nr:MAG: permease [Bdellovibrionales bacterium RIFOXYC1_FULL_37_79]OFZ59308.1 MAG: permease [Bdellovibrionales bacterium RIFOXYB1_FULL_37_110]OFZ62934.1 MAG: permease [Bdellovibrionales bacterium RIFOXYD1_FULL_36_51]